MSPQEPRGAPIEELAGKSQIAGILATHSRGVDRADGNLLSSAYHPDAGVDYSFFDGPASQLVAILAAAQKGQPVTSHRTSNMWIKVRGPQARSESYVLAYAEQIADSAATQRFIGGRYLDTHERRDGEWRLSHRKYVMDFNINRPSTVNWPEPAVALANSTYTDAQTDQALSKQALHDLGMAYARAIDRADASLMASIFHEDATVVSGVFNGNAAEFAVKITAFVRENIERCFHSVANEWHEVHGDEAVGESYVIANTTAGGKDTLTGGRYVDAYQRRNGVWKFKARTFVVDWTNAQPTSYETGGMYAALTARGCYGASDPVYAFWKQ